MEPILDRARAWLRDDCDKDTKSELSALLTDADLHMPELEDRFAGSLEFGTAGLRGIIGAGSNRMNRAVVRRATYGLGKELWANASAAPIVVIGFDGRRLSDVFAEDAACVLVEMGIRVHLFDGVGPTPLTAFAVSNLRADAGIMVTASHNPPEYNGYKVYWSGGGQIVPPIDTNIAKRIEEAPAAKNVPLKALAAAKKSGQLTSLGADMKKAYLEGVAKLGRPGGDRAYSIVYTAMHGVGDELARQALAQAGFGHVTSVPEQQKPDGAFPTVKFPNPEEKGAMDLSFACAKREKADLILANDPDADRLAVAVPDASSATGYLQFTGNEVGVLLGHYVLTRDEEAREKRMCLASIVSSPMLGVIAGKLGVRYEETLTGFKWIAHRAMEVERESGETFEFGYEEALGYTVGTLVRDKDGVSAAMVFAELIAKLRADKKTAQQRLEELFREYGLFVSEQVSVTKKGTSGQEEIAGIMKRLRESPPATLGGLAVVSRADYGQRTRIAKDGTRSPIALPSSNVLLFDLDGGSRVIARPSGTEPKVKFYFDVREDVTKGEPMAAAEKRAKEKLARVRDEFVKLAV